MRKKVKELMRSEEGMNMLKRARLFITIDLSYIVTAVK